MYTLHTFIHLNATPPSPSLGFGGGFLVWNLLGADAFLAGGGETLFFGTKKITKC